MADLEDRPHFLVNETVTPRVGSVIPASEKGIISNSVGTNDPKFMIILTAVGEAAEARVALTVIAT